MTYGTRFVEVPKHRLVATLEAVGAAATAGGGAHRWTESGYERVFELITPGERGVVRVFTTLDDNGELAGFLRPCGADAVRVCVGIRHNGAFRGTAPTQKLLRTAPHNVGDRVWAWLARVSTRTWAAYERAKLVSYCPACGAPMVRRNGQYGPFMGCVEFPTCKHTENL